MKFFTTTIDENGIAVLSYSRPPVNAFSNEAYAEFDQALLELRRNSDVRVIILYTPDKWFSVGNDVKAAGQNPTWSRATSQVLLQLIRGSKRAPFPLSRRSAATASAQVSVSL